MYVHVVYIYGKSDTQVHSNIMRLAAQQLWPTENLVCCGTVSLTTLIGLSERKNERTLSHDCSVARFMTDERRRNTLPITLKKRGGREIGGVKRGR